MPTKAAASRKMERHYAKKNKEEQKKCNQGLPAISQAAVNREIKRALAAMPVLVLLDVMLPGLDGFEVCRRLRAERPRLPVLMLTARGSEGDILEGFRSGADDYVTKPFSISELIARVGALLRRAGSEPSAETFSFGGWHIDAGALTARQGEVCHALTRREAELLASPERPIVLLRARADAALAPEVAPGRPWPGRGAGRRAG